MREPIIPGAEALQTRQVNLADFSMSKISLDAKVRCEPVRVMLHLPGLKHALISGESPVDPAPHSPQIGAETHLAAGIEVKVMVVCYELQIGAHSCCTLCVSQESGVKSTPKHAAALCVYEVG